MASRAGDIRVAAWWKENGNSLILMPEPFIEEKAFAEMKKNSLPAGSPF